jgi:hypothetical protein
MTLFLFDWLAASLGRKNYLLAGVDVGSERAAAACWSKPPSSTASIPKPICEVSSRIVEHPINRIAELLQSPIPVAA